MSTGAYTRRLFLAAVGAASVAALIYLTDRQRKRRRRCLVQEAEALVQQESETAEPVPDSQENQEEDRLSPVLEKSIESLERPSSPVMEIKVNAFGDMPTAQPEIPSVSVESASEEYDVVKITASGDAPPSKSEIFVDVPEQKDIKSVVVTQLPAESNGYKNAESPSGTSTNSEGSADSGRATGGPNCSPFEHSNDFEIYPVYEFEVPNTLVGLIIGVQGKTISELCNRAQVRMLIRPHHTLARIETHQICSIEGKRQNINKCLHMIRYRFPQNRFPDLNLKPVLPPTVLETPKVVGSEPTALSLPVGAPCEVLVCSTVDAGHFFVQLPTHPTFSSLSTLDYYTMNIYSNLSGVPVLPKPVVPGVVCIAPTCNGWFRAITLDYDESEDAVLVRYADYGGFATLPRTELRQIRSDLTSLPMQAIECYLAHVQPSDGTVHWSPKAVETFVKLCSNRIVHAELVGYNKDNNIPYLQLCTVDEKKNVKRVDHVLLEMGYAKPADPAKMVAVQFNFARNSSKASSKR